MEVCINLTTATSENQWSYVLSHFKPSQIYLIGDYKTSDKIYNNAIKGLPDKDLIILAPKNGRYIQGEIPLNEFKHPSDAVYYFGSDREHMNNMEGTKVYIPTDDNSEMYSWVAGAITFWDRLHG